ncbi:peptide-methionine (R)-S-oxide reductase MsrB [Salinisphaera sp. T31B1]|uniref:peptide-methionine (R)-S-oxide reductase MsrB n=1 Tax=Salinisphaera sp. T31B1 TaxID=727963 RepID=UPI00333F97F8
MKRRTIIGGGLGVVAVALGARLAAGALLEGASGTRSAQEFAVDKSDQAWRAQLSPEAYQVLRKAGTEAPGSSRLNSVKAVGEYRCAGCDQTLFASDTKYDSGTGWPSFYDYVDGALGFKTDYKMLIPRREYHCSRCGGHQGHVFKDGPAPTGLRYCNNGVALSFVAAEQDRTG